MKDLELDHLRSEEERTFADLRKAGEQMEAQAHELEERLERFDDDIVGAEEVIDVYLRQANGGTEPEHPAYWRAAQNRQRKRRRQSRR